jgi:hypothetical protein
MIALCVEHHAHADAGAFASEQLKQLKQDALQSANVVSARFNWLRRDLLAVVGENFYHETQVILQYRDIPAIWFTRDAERHLLLNVRMLSKDREPRLLLEENDWVLHGAAENLECPPSGKLLIVRYPNGDALRVEFFELNTLADVERRYPEANLAGRGMPIPITAVEVHYEIGGTGLRFGPKETTFGNGGRISNAYASNVVIAVHLM